jgi:hypothetical protein
VDARPLRLFNRTRQTPARQALEVQDAEVIARRLIDRAFETRQATAPV